MTAYKYSISCIVHIESAPVSVLWRKTLFDTVIPLSLSPNLHLCLFCGERHCSTPLFHTLSVRICTCVCFVEKDTVRHRYSTLSQSESAPVSVPWRKTLFDTFIPHSLSLNLHLCLLCGERHCSTPLFHTLSVRICTCVCYVEKDVVRRRYSTLWICTCVWFVEKDTVRHRYSTLSQSESATVSVPWRKTLFDTVIPHSLSPNLHLCLLCGERHCSTPLFHTLSVRICTCVCYVEKDVVRRRYSTLSKSESAPVSVLWRKTLFDTFIPHSLSPNLHLCLFLGERHCSTPLFHTLSFRICTCVCFVEKDTVRHTLSQSESAPVSVLWRKTLFDTVIPHSLSPNLHLCLFLGERHCSTHYVSLERDREASKI